MSNHFSAGKPRGRGIRSALPRMLVYRVAAFAGPAALLALIHSTTL